MSLSFIAFSCAPSSNQDEKDEQASIVQPGESTEKVSLIELDKKISIIENRISELQKSVDRIENIVKSFEFLLSSKSPIKSVSFINQSQTLSEMKKVFFDEITRKKALFENAIQKFSSENAPRHVIDSCTKRISSYEKTLTDLESVQSKEGFKEYLKRNRGTLESVFPEHYRD
jgi:prefoldin subunit 5